MKVCVISPLFHPWLVGGAEVYVTTLVKEISRDHEVVVITTVGAKDREFQNVPVNPKIMEIKPRNIASIYEILESAKVGFFKKLLWHVLDFWNLSSYLKIKKILIMEKPDLVFTNGVKGLSLSVFSAIKSIGIPHVHFLHDFELISRWVTLFKNGKPISCFNFLDRLYILYSRKLSASIGSVISPSRFVMDFHERMGYFTNSDRYIIPNGVELDYDSVPLTKNTKEFLFIGRISENKGVQIAVKAFQKLKEKEARLHLIGTGPCFETIKIMAENDNRIVLHGFVDKEKMEMIRKKCSYLLVPSIWYESFALVINENMNKGIPVIASKIGGIPEIVKDGYNGFLFEPGNVDSLYKIMKSVIDDFYDFKKLSENAISSSKNFSISKQVEKTIDVFRETIKKTIMKTRN